MTQFEFLSVFISIVLALGVSDILSTWGEQIRFRSKVRHYWLHTAWGILLLLLMIQAWWGLWRFRDREDWTFFENVTLIVPYLLLALTVYVLTPRISSEPSDIKDYYYVNAPWIFGLGGGALVAFTINAKVNLGTGLLDPQNAIRAVGIMIMAGLAVSRRERVHAGAAALAAILLIAWISTTLLAL
ncbi:MAG: hypothetical protein AAGF92_19075 [Myxococcota bacterium]